VSYIDNPSTGGAGGTPSNSVVTEQSFGQADSPGTSSEYSRGDHTHGTPAAAGSGQTYPQVLSAVALGL
jgi:hypothetical protein